VSTCCNSADLDSYASFTGPSTLDTIAMPTAKKAEEVIAPTAEETQSAYLQQLAEVPEFSSYGAVLHSGKPTQLTENETEYQVVCVKHLFKTHLVFQVSYCLRYPLCALC
jgi:coatomer protein complex subunit gamma